MDRTAGIRRPAGESGVLRDDAQRIHRAAVADFHVDPDDRADADRHVTPYAHRSGLHPLPVHRVAGEAYVIADDRSVTKRQQVVVGDREYQPRRRASPQDAKSALHLLE